MKHVIERVRLALRIGMPLLMAAGISSYSYAQFPSRTDVPGGPAVQRARIPAIVLPEGAFLEALHSHHFQVDRATGRRAVELAAQANSPGTTALVAVVDKEDGPQSFAGTIFVVVRDPLSPQRGAWLTAHDFYVAAVELSGRSPWLARSASFMLDPELPALALLPGTCCGPSTVCVPDSGGPGPNPGVCGPDEICTGPDLGVSRNPPPGPGWPRNPTGPQVPLKVFQSGTGVQATAFTGSCTERRVNPSCGITLPVCNADDAGFVLTEAGAASVDVGSACAMGSRPANGREIPEWCLYAYTDSPNAPECRGAHFEGIRQSLDRVMNSATLPADFVPPMCERARVTQDSNICTTASEQQQRKALDEGMVRATFGFMGGQRCEPTGRMVHDKHGQWGLSQCAKCEPGINGHCKQWVQLTSVDAKDEAPAENTAPKKTEVVFDEGLTITGNVTRTKEKEQQDTVISASLNRLLNPPEPMTRNTDSNTPQSPDPNKAKPRSDVQAKDTRPVNRPPSRQNGKKADPILLGDGSFDLSHIDLSFPGPVRPLEIMRTYNSRSTDRSTLGSNWHHNWDVWLERLTPDNTPTWAMPYCLGTDPGLVPRFTSDPPGSEPRTTCLILHRGDASNQLFFLDLGTYLFMPQAGSTDTLATTSDGGWAVRSRDGEVQRFNGAGFLVEQRDRFGNGFNLEYEPTPLWELYTTYCNATELQQRNETKYGRRCAFIAYLVGDGPPATPMSGWTLDAADYPLPGEIGLRKRLEYAVAYLLWLNNLDIDALPPYGTRRMRPTRVTDDIGRSLVFTYAHAPSCLPPVLCSGGLRFDFIGTPNAELLESVTGPGGTELRFTYSQAPQTPADYLETFLTGVERSDLTGVADDVVASLPRSYTYYYQWPGGPVESFGAYLQRVHDAYRAFYATFIGCSFVPLSPCGERGRPQISVGDPDRLAKRAAYAYISDVIDNLIRVDDTPAQPTGATSVGRLPSIQSETRYEIDPWSRSFDRAYAQRYGSGLAQQDPTRIEPDRPRDNWASSLPKATFTYWPARNGRVPSQVSARYPLEAEPLRPGRVEIPPVAGDTSAPNSSSCDYRKMEELRMALPGWTEPVEYFDAPAMTASIDGSLAGTPLYCEQLSAATYGDPTHNDLMSSLDPVTNTPQLYDHVVRRIVGQRATTTANGNRICGWSQVRDRDGDLHVYGMNFRGQTLVDAVEERASTGGAPTGTFIYSETVYNADGLPKQQRRPMRGLRRWQESEGYERFEFDEIDPTGARGWNEWLPAFWARRMNLTRVEVHPRGGEVLDLEESTNTFARSAGRYQSFAYEPLFNQLRKSESGSLSPRVGSTGTPPWTDVPNERITFTFDYQELSAAPGAPVDRSLGSILDSFRGWGFGWAMTATGAPDYDEITTWQLPMPFYDTDLNGDGAIGFGSGTGAQRLVRGVPIAVYREGKDATLAPQGRMFAWAPHGQLAQVTGADGEQVLFDYYSRQPQASPDEIFGGPTPPTDVAVTGERAGFLGRVRTLRFAEYAPGAGPGIAPCPLLAGPYQALLPPTCSDPTGELTKLGLPTPAVEAVLAAAGSAKSVSDPERYETLSLSYNTLGHVRYRWSEARATNLVHDTDGRVIRATDPVGTTFENQHSTRGFLERTKALDALGKPLAELQRGFDGNGAIVYECLARIAGGCSSTPRAGSERFFKYWPEGALREAVDPEGLVSRFDYDERGRLISERHRNPAFPADVPMQVRYAHDDDANLQRATYAPGTSLQRTESFVHDGLNRITTHTNTRGYAWQSAYTSRDKLARQKRADLPYDLRAMPAGSWETLFTYDSFGELVRKEDNGVETLRLRRTAGGRAFAHSAAGTGQTLATFDRTGRPAWLRDPAGTVTVFTHRTAGNEETASAIRRSVQDTLTTATISTLDAAERLTLQVEYAGGDERRTSWTLDGLGRATSETNDEGFVTRFSYDLAGFMWATEQQRTVGAAPQFDVTGYTYDGRGRVRKVTDPGNQITEFDYDGFGRLKERRSPGQVQVKRGFTYDALGRIEIETIGANRIRHAYDGRGDPTQEQWFTGATSTVVITERTFDDLGRVRMTRYTNPTLMGLNVTRRTIARAFTYDSLGRVATDQIRVALQPAHTVSSDWSLAAGLWQRSLSYELGPVNAEWLESYDAALRLSRVRSVAGSTTQFAWVGDLYVGRDQEQQQGWQSPFRERLALDRFGEATGWRYTAIDLDANRQPVNAQESPRYCGSAWNVRDCARPLLTMDALRDSMGRIVSLSTSFGHPTFSGGTLVPRTPAQPWRGYAYDPPARLAQLWEHTGQPAPVSTQGLTTHRVRTSDISRLGASGTRWDYGRETAVGGTLSIRSPASERWSLPIPRGAGHQLRRALVDQRARVAQHDAVGQVIVDGKFAYTFDPRGQLAVVSRNGVPMESYLYDAQGQLTAVTQGAANQPREIFAYDGAQMVAAFGAANRPLWEAAWGPGIDHLVVWRDLAGAGGEHIPLVDQGNSVIGTWQTAAGRISSTAEYDAEGRLEVRDPAGTVVCAERGTGTVCASPGRMPFGYGTAWRSSVSGLVYLRNRWYSPELTQFISQDPLGYAVSYNPYAYTGFDPINQSDPFGLEAGIFLRGRAIVQYDSDPGPGASFTYVLCPSCHDDRSGLAGTTAREMTRSEELTLRLITAAGLSLIEGAGIASAGIGSGGGLLVSSRLGPPAGGLVAVTVPAVVTQTTVAATATGATFLIVMSSAGNGGPTRSQLTGPNKRNANTRPDSDPKKCAYCGEKPEVTDHVKPIKSVKELVKDRALTLKEGKALADSRWNLVRACPTCNSGLKRGLELGTEFKPKVPNEVVKRLMDWMANPNTKWLVGNAAVMGGPRPEVPELPKPTGGTLGTDPVSPLLPTEPGPVCSPKDLTCRLRQ